MLLETTAFLSPQFIAATPCGSVFILVFTAKSLQIMFLQRVGGGAREKEGFRLNPTAPLPS